jgi:hypothetical protein
MINASRSNYGYLYLPIDSNANFRKHDRDALDIHGGRYVKGKFSESDAFFIPKDNEHSHLFICETAINDNYYKAAFTVKSEQFLNAYVDGDTSHVVNFEPMYGHYMAGDDEPTINNDARPINGPESYQFYRGDDGKSYPLITFHHYRDGRLDMDNVVDFTKLKTCKFYEVVPNQSKYFKDCLTTAEDLICNIYPNKMPDYVRSHLRGEVTLETGDRDDKNLKIAKDFNAGIDADPEIAQAFFTVYDAKENENTSKTGEMSLCSTWPYHAAAVVGKDKNDRITLEVFAGSRDATMRQKDLYTFKMWKVGDPKDSFHGNLVNKAKNSIIDKISKKLCYDSDVDTPFYAQLRKLIPDLKLRHQLVDTLAEDAYGGKNFSHTNTAIQKLVNVTYQKFIQNVVQGVTDKLKLPVGTVVIEGKK